MTRCAARHLTIGEASEAIAGYVVALDITERRHEFGSSPAPWTWSDLPAKTLGKSFDTFCPTGPALVTLDELADPIRLRKRCWINGELTFDHSTADMLRSAAELVALISQFMTIPTGVICLAGCGSTRDGSPIPFLKPGDDIVTEIEGIGRLTNRYVAEGPDR